MGRAVATALTATDACRGQIRSQILKAVCFQLLIQTNGATGTQARTHAITHARTHACSLNCVNAFLCQHYLAYFSFFYKCPPPLLLRRSLALFYALFLIVPFFWVCRTWFIVYADVILSCLGLAWLGLAWLVLGCWFLYSGFLLAYSQETFQSIYTDWEPHPNSILYSDLWRAKFSGQTVEIPEDATATAHQRVGVQHVQMRYFLVDKISKGLRMLGGTPTAVLHII